MPDRARITNFLGQKLSHQPPIDTHAPPPAYRPMRRKSSIGEALLGRGNRRRNLQSHQNAQVWRRSPLTPSLSQVISTCPPNFPKPLNLQIGSVRMFSRESLDRKVLQPDAGK